MTKPENPPAFPFVYNKLMVTGMTLLDYFASQVIVPLIMASNYDRAVNVETAYEIARLMLIEREKHL